MRHSEDLARRLAVEFPRLDPIMAEHLTDQEGELLPYLFMADVARWAQATYRSDPVAVGALVDWLEREFVSAAAAERDLIGLGFVETLLPPPEGTTLLMRLGPELTQVARDLGLLR